MLTVRRTTPRRVTLPAVLTAVESTAALGIAHTATGGAVPSLLWLAAFGVLVYGAGVAVLRRRITLRAALPALVAVQLLGHAWLVTVTTGAEAHHHEPGPLLGLSVPMVAAHLVAAAVAGVVWAARRRAVVLVLHWADQGMPAIPGLRDRLAAASTHHPKQQHPTDAAPTRGPPGSLVPA